MLHISHQMSTISKKLQYPRSKGSLEDFQIFIHIGHWKGETFFNLKILWNKEHAHYCHTCKFIPPPGWVYCHMNIIKCLQNWNKHSLCAPLSNKKTLYVCRKENPKFVEEHYVSMSHPPRDDNSTNGKFKSLLLPVRGEIMGKAMKHHFPVSHLETFVLLLLRIEGFKISSSVCTLYIPANSFHLSSRTFYIKIISATREISCRMSRWRIKFVYQKKFRNALSKHF